MAKIMRTIRDVKSDISNESLSTQPLMSDDYTYGNNNDLKEIVEDEISGEDFSDESMIGKRKRKKDKR